MTPINWAMSPEVYEDMVSCLLSHLNRETRRIDGSGGDGGRDVQFELPDGSLSAQPVSCPSESPLEPVFAEFVGNLAMIQAATGIVLSLIHISEPTRLGMISYAVFCLT